LSSCAVSTARLKKLLIQSVAPLSTVYRIIEKGSRFNFRSGRVGWIQNRRRHRDSVVLRRQGLTAQEIANAVHWSLSTVYRISGKKSHKVD